MGLKKCPVCGEKFADTYKRCPFCEEDENPRKAKQPKRYESGGRRLARRQYEEPAVGPVYEDDNYRPRRSASEADDYPEDDSYKGRRSARVDDDYEEEYYDDYDDDRGSPWLKVVIAVLIVIIIACLLYLGRGPIGNLLHSDSDVDPNPSSSMVSDDEPNPGDEDIVDPNTNGEENPDIPVVPDDVGNPDGEDTENDPVVSENLTLSHEDVTIAGGESFTLQATGSSGNVTYRVKDSSIATVSDSGVVTGLKKGWTEVEVQSGSASAICIVRVSSTAETTNGETQEPNTNVTLTLNSEDFTLSVGESHVLKATGISDGISWSVKDASIATVSDSGKVVAVAKGTTTVTASWNGQTAKCIVRVK